MEIPFKKIKVATFVGYDIRKISDDIGDFFEVPAHSDYELVWIDTQTISRTPNTVNGLWPQDLWQITTLIYKEG